MTSDFSPEVEIQPFRTCEMKNTQLFMAELPKFFHLLGNRGRGTDGDVRFFTGIGDTAVSRMHNASGHNYWNSSFIMDVAMGQIPRSTECIFSIMYRA